MGNHRLELTGMTFGRVTVVEFYGMYKGRSHWKYKCSCGAEGIATHKSLRNGNTTSCGCKRKETLSKLNKKPYGESSFHKVYLNYLCGAKERGLVFNITKDKFKEITKQNCFYCGCVPSQISINLGGDKTKQKRYCNGEYIYNGVDRIDNTKGYIENNIVPCCKQCNTMKMNYSLDSFKDKIYKIYHRMFNGDNT